jgi:molecular chaperone DnaK
LKDKVKPEQAERVNKLTQEIRDAISSNNAETIKAKIQELKNILAEISTAAYQGAAPSGAAGPQAGAAGAGAGFGGSGGGSAAGPNPNP